MQNSALCDLTRCGEKPPGHRQAGYECDHLQQIALALSLPMIFRTRIDSVAETLVARLSLTPETGLMLLGSMQI
jgi:hypothetical protein